MAQIPVVPNAGHLAARLEAQADNPNGAVAAPAPVFPAVNPEHMRYKRSKSNRLNSLPRLVVNFVRIHARVGGSLICYPSSFVVCPAFVYSRRFPPVSSFFFAHVCSNFYWVRLFSLPTTWQFFSVLVYVPDSRIFCLVYLPSLGLSRRICYSFIFVT